MTFNQPLDLQYWLVNVFAGSMELFLLICFIIIVAMAAKFRMNNTVMLVLMALFVMMMVGAGISGTVGGIYFLIILLTGLIVLYTISKITR